MKKFISEDDLDSFGGFLEYQGIDRSSVSTAELAEWRDIFNESRATKLASARVGAMKLTKIEGMYQYAVAVREDSKLFLTLWVRRNKKFEFFVMIPRSDREWDPHISYHRDGRLHSKSFGEKNLIQERQPLTAPFEVPSR